MANGIPALAVDIAFDAVALLTSDLTSEFGSQQQVWGLFDQNGNEVVTAESVVSFEFRQDYQVSDYLVEQGAFETYNKVAIPYDVRLRFSQGGSVTERAAVQAQIDAIIGGTELFDAVTPTKVYQNVNPTHQSLRHTSTDGVGLLIVDVYCRQIRVSSSTTFTNTQSTAPNGTSGSSLTPNTPFGQRFDAINNPQSPSASPQVAGGNVQPVTPTGAQQTQINELVAGGNN